MGSVTVVFDTNVLVSAMGFGGTPEECVSLAFGDDVLVFTSPKILRELRRVLSYDRLPFTEEERAELPKQFLEMSDAKLIEPDVTVEVVEADPDDNKFLECAIEANADVVLSGDDHLLNVETFRGIDVLEPAEFVGRMESGPPDD